MPITISHDELGTAVSVTSRQELLDVSETLKAHGFKNLDGRSPFRNEGTAGFQLFQPQVDRVLRDLEKLRHPARMGTILTTGLSTVPQSMLDAEKILQEFYGSEPADEVKYRRHPPKYIETKRQAALKRLADVSKNHQYAFGDVDRRTRIPLHTASDVLERLSLGAELGAVDSQGKTFTPRRVEHSTRDTFTLQGSTDTNWFPRTHVLSGSDRLEVIDHDSFALAYKNGARLVFSFVTEGVQLEDSVLEELAAIEEELHSWERELEYAATVRKFTFWSPEHFELRDEVTKNGSKGVVDQRPSANYLQTAVPGKRKGTWKSGGVWPYYLIDSRKRGDQQIDRAPSGGRRVGSIVQRLRIGRGLEPFPFDSPKAEAKPPAVPVTPPTPEPVQPVPVPVPRLETQRKLRGHNFYPPAAALKKIPKLGSNDVKNVADDDVTIHLHYFGGSTDVYVAEYDSTTNTAYAWICLGGNTTNAEWGSVSLAEIEAAGYSQGLVNRTTKERSTYRMPIERDCYWSPTRAADIGMPGYTPTAPPEPVTPATPEPVQPAPVQPVSTEQIKARLGGNSAQQAMLNALEGTGRLVVVPVGFPTISKPKPAPTQERASEEADQPVSDALAAALAAADAKHLKSAPDQGALF